MFSQFVKRSLHAAARRLSRLLPAPKIADEQPLKAELFNIDQFKQHAGALAARHSVSFKRGGEKLLARLKENEAIILRAYELLNQAGSAKRRISPAGDWLLDNYYLIEEQIRLAQRFLPKGYSRELPKLTKGPLAGYPRVYDIAMEIVSHGDGRLDSKGLAGFVAAYQQVKHLKLGELWAVPIMIRLALIENLRRIASRMIVAQLDRDVAEYRATRILDVLAKDTSGVILEIAAMAKVDLPMSDAFVAEFVRQLHGQSPAFNIPIGWLEKKLAENGQTIERLIQSANHKQASSQVSISNTIESLRFLEITDWHEFVENLSVVEKELLRDPSGHYERMSFATRDGYRHVVENLALRCGLEEEEVAARAVQAAREAKSAGGGPDAASHIGYHLVDRGLERFCRSLGLRLRFGDYLLAKKTALPLAFYTGSVSFFALATAAALLLLAWERGLGGWPWFAAFGFPLLLVTSQAAITLVNWFATRSVAPQKLPRMDFSEGIPASAHTLTVIPTMLTGARAVDALLEGIEVCYLGNVDANVEFALLTDFPDADRETLPGDAALLAQAAEGIEKLNGKYRAQKDGIFHLFHRPRRWNEREKVWMGYERKRGKLADLNALLRGGGQDRFTLISGDVQRLQDVRYVITLDTDTRMPRDAARDLAGIMSHPLNRPVYDEKKGRVTAGYGILQPRVDLGYPGDEPSLFVKIFGGEPGIDPYTKTVSDIYQDLFHEGSFIGKGLYDVDAFERSLGGRLPENLILSHDLLEGCYARSALVTDVQLYEKYPPGYLADMNRRHRWIRGDWQISAWLLPFVPGPGGRNPLSLLSKWKILDNLRRSLVPAAAAWVLLAGWLFFAPDWFWPAVIAALYGFPVLFISCVEAASKNRDIPLRTHFDSTLYSFGVRGAQFGLSLAFLVHEAFRNLHAVTVTYWRMLVSRRRLLEWRISGEAELQSARTAGDYARGMPAGPLAALCLAGVLQAGGRLDALAAAFCGLWLVSPGIACLLGRPPLSRKAGLSGARVLYLRGLSRKIWGFFETFVTERDNWLPPDNFQEEFLGAVAHRTSPTNIGLSLLSGLAAYDFGYLSMGALFNRTEKTLKTLGGMEKYRGHFYNWYDTESLKPLKPHYVSSVDSGNMVGHLLVLRAGLLELKDGKIVPPQLPDGLADTLAVLQECAAELETGRAGGAADSARQAVGQIARLRQKLTPAPGSLSELHARLRVLSAESSRTLSGLQGKHFEKTRRWLRAFEKQCYDCLEDMAFIAPWVLLAPEIPGMWDRGDDLQKERLSRLRGELLRLEETPSLAGTARLELKLFPLIDAVLAGLSLSGEDSGREKEWFTLLRGAVKAAGDRASERMVAIDAMALACTELSAVEFEFLYDKRAHLLSIGYNVSEHRPDPGCYDLLASESRLASFVAIAQGKLPQKHWFMLGRLLSRYGGEPVLVSWGGSMFEYLMPLLVMPVYEGTLLEGTYKAMVACQIDYAAGNGIPWGMSESGYNKLDAALAYQYRSFGVPDIGFKRGLLEDLVVAPYAAALALMVEPEKACGNLERLAAEGFGGEYGFYEAIDYTPSRAAHDGTRAVVRSYMAHHQGMSLLALAYTLLDRPMQRRFLADPMFKATELLLQERVPKVSTFVYDAEVSGLLRKTEESDALSRVFTTPNTPSPETHLLSNGRYNLMLTNSGGGYTRWKNLAVTRWHEDSVMEGEGTFVYLRDAATGEFWSSAYQPTLKKPAKYEAIFSRSRAEFRRRDHNIDLHTEITVSPEDNIDLRRLHVRNLSRETRIIELTSYAEVVLNQGAADLSHRAFSNLFVQTEIIRTHQAILCTRRPRSEKEKFPVLAHFMAVHGNSIVDASYETDREKFIGRGNTAANPAALREKVYLSDSEGPVLDPVVAIRCRIKLEPGETAVVDYVTGVCDSREGALAVIEKYRDRNLADRVFDLAWTHGQVALQQINATESDAQVYGRLASAILYANPEWRAHASVLKQNRRGQTDLWGYDISGDLPIVIVRIEDQENIGLIARMVQAHAYWRMKGLPVDLVIWNENSSVYRDSLSEKINDLIAPDSKQPEKRPGRIFSRRADQMSEEDKILMQTVARVVISDRGGTLAEHLDRVARLAEPRPLFPAAKKHKPEVWPHVHAQRPDLAYFNGLGGFTRDGREYVISTGPAVTPAPWVNVLANRHFGTVISESGSAYTWAENAHQFRLTPWKNDPVTDASGEALYLRDEETGHFWSPTPLPAGRSGYVSRHGFGYSIFEHAQDGVTTELTVFVALDHPVKFAVLKLRNASGRRRSLSATSYNELVMGVSRDSSQMHILTEVDPKSGALTAYNHYNKEFPDRVVFLDVSETARFVSGDRREFIGRNGTLAAPAAMHNEGLSGKTGAGLDPCAAMQVKFDLDDGEEKEIVFTFGAAKSADEARAILQRFGGNASVRSELEAVWEYWKRTLGVVYVETPDDSINFLVNGWLQYQVLSCRLWGRSGFYQSGGAYGFRDQLQDVMALTYSHPALVRQQLLSFASRQFAEGDVQHWWHPPSGRGVRSHCSDDYLWLPLVTCLYVGEIGDTGVLDEPAGFLEGPPVKPEEESYYDLPGTSARTGTLYEHCVLAVKNSLKFGAHGLPLIGSGDWNDGMNLVGREGKGESVWLAFFLCHVLKAMSALAAGRGDREFSALCLEEAGKLAGNIEANAWDGQWYRRAYFDNGEPLGSDSNAECRIDSLPQAWAVISGAAAPERAAAAMEQVDRRLVDRKNSLIKLFEPPFDKCACDPGYIKGYLPGVRENGGQYTHGAVWSVMAFALLKDSARAWELLGLINPVRHGDTPGKCAVYKVEPFVMPGDVYAGGVNAGRGGWTWYTGSAAWTYQLIVKHLLGLRLKVDQLHFEPCLPEEWRSFKVHYRYRETFFHINIERSGPGDSVVSVAVDGMEREDKCIPLSDDRSEHQVEVRIGRDSPEQI